MAKANKNINFNLNFESQRVKSSKVKYGFHDYDSSPIKQLEDASTYHRTSQYQRWEEIFIFVSNMKEQPQDNINLLLHYQNLNKKDQKKLNEIFSWS